MFDNNGERDYNKITTDMIKLKGGVVFLKKSVRKVRMFVLIEVKIIVALIAAAASIIVAAIGYEASTYQARHDDSGIECGYTEKLTFKKSDEMKSATFSAKPYTGTMYIAVMQTTGTTGTKYNVKWKKSTSSSYTNIGTASNKKNNVWTSEKKCGKVKKGTKYNFCVTKKSNYGTASKIQVDWLLK